MSHVCRRAPADPAERPQLSRNKHVWQSKSQQLTFINALLAKDAYSLTVPGCWSLLQMRIQVQTQYSCTGCASASGTAGLNWAALPSAVCLFQLFQSLRHNYRIKVSYRGLTQGFRDCWRKVGFRVLSIWLARQRQTLNSKPLNLQPKHNFAYGAELWYDTGVWGPQNAYWSALAPCSMCTHVQSDIAQMPIDLLLTCLGFPDCPFICWSQIRTLSHMYTCYQYTVILYTRCTHQLHVLCWFAWMSCLHSWCVVVSAMPCPQCFFKRTDWPACMHFRHWQQLLFWFPSW